MNILQRIFTDYYEEIKYTLHPRKTEMENIDKMLGCGDPSFGGAMYVCTHCGNFKFVPFRCHSRFCPTCGNKYAMERTTNMSFKLVNVAHRHCVFTIDENLRDFFLYDRSLLNCLFMQLTASFPVCFSNLINPKTSLPALSWFYIPLAETSNGILYPLPSFRKVGLVSDGFWRHVSHFNYSYLSQCVPHCTPE
ncbi:MAG: transposase zinc-binding domain-containing protein [Coprococcus phoceensis]